MSSRFQLLEHHGEATIATLQRLKLLVPCDIYLTDHQKAARFSLSRGLKRSQLAPDQCDVQLSSAALAYCFRHLWGGNTLLVNGRYQAPPSGNFERFRRYLLLSDLANHDKPVASYVQPRVTRACSMRSLDRVPGFP